MTYQKGYDDGFSDGITEKMDTTRENLKKIIYRWMCDNYGDGLDVIDVDVLAAHLSEKLTSPDKERNNDR